MKKILVTGGAGFIGSHLVKALAAASYEIWILDNLDPFYSVTLKQNNLAELKKIGEICHFVEGDLCDSSLWEGGAIPPVDVIVHLAAKAGVRPSIEDPVGYYRSNVDGTLQVLEFARKNKVSKVIFASSSSVYGNCSKDTFRENEPELLPISPYASTKLAGEGLGHVYSHLYNIQFIALRFFTVYGPGQRPDLAIHKFTKMILEDQPIPFFGDGSTSRDYTFVDDVVQGVLKAVDYEGVPYQIFNLGNDRSISLNLMVETIERALGKSAKLRKLPMQAGDVVKTIANIDRARRELDYFPKTEFAAGVQAFVDWFVVHQEICCKTK